MPSVDMIGAYQTSVRTINRVFAGACCVLALVIVVTVILSITLRAVGAPLVWADDVAQIAFLYLFFLGLAPALESGHHVAVELFDTFVPGRIQRYLGVVSTIFIAAFSLIFLLQLWKLTGRSFATGRLASTVLPIPLQWLQIAGPVGVAHLLLTAISMAISEIRALRLALNTQGP